MVPLTFCMPPHDPIKFITCAVLVYLIYLLSGSHSDDLACPSLSRFLKRSPKRSQAGELVDLILITPLFQK